MSKRHNCKKPRGGAIFASICAAALVGASAFGGITHTYEDNDATLVVTVDSGSETMDASWVTAPDSTTGATVTKIKKEGAGTLVAVPIPSFTGDFSIEAGVYSYLQVGDFGATNTTASAGVIDIKEGAKILHTSTASAPPAGTRVASAASMTSEPSVRISSLSSPTAFSSRSERSEFEQTSSANPSHLCAGVRLHGFISYSVTG